MASPMISTTHLLGAKFTVALVALIQRTVDKFDVDLNRLFVLWQKRTKWRVDHVR